MDLYETDVTSSAGAEHELYADSLDKFPTSWAPDGKNLLFSAQSPNTGTDVWVLSTTGDGRTARARAFINTPANEGQGRFSPDGRWVAYQSDESGRVEVYVAPFPGPGRPQPVSTGGGSGPRWRVDGKELFFVTPDQRMDAAAIDTTGASVVVSRIEQLFQVRVDAAAGLNAWDVAPDGQRFLIASPVDEPRPPSLSLIVNWPATLRR